MYTEQDYLNGWLMYGCGAVLIFGAGFLLTVRVPWWRLRLLLRVALAAALAVPWYAEETSRFLAPAWIVAGFEGVFEGGEAFWRAGGPLITGVAVAVTLTGICLLTIWLLKVRAARAAQPQP